MISMGVGESGAARGWADRREALSWRVGTICGRAIGDGCLGEIAGETPRGMGDAEGGMEDDRS